MELKQSWVNNKKLLVLLVGLISLPGFFFIFLFIGLFFVHPVKMEGKSMMPTINHGDRIFVMRRVSKLERGDVIVFFYPKDPSKSFLKRIVGLPGETIEFREGKVLISGRYLEEPYVDLNPDITKDTIMPYRVPPGHYYVLGDNRGTSNDSRHWGPLPEANIYGKYLWRYGRAGESSK